MVDDVIASSFVGIDRALQTKSWISIKGKDLYGADKEIRIPICSVGVLLGLKLRGFKSRKAPKDAYDILLLVMNYNLGYEKAIEAFHKESQFASWIEALESLKENFMSESQDGALRAAAFIFGDRFTAKNDENYQKLLAQVVTVGQALLK